MFFCWPELYHGIHSLITPPPPQKKQKSFIARAQQKLHFLSMYICMVGSATYNRIQLCPMLKSIHNLLFCYFQAASLNHEQMPDQLEEVPVLCVHSSGLQIGNTYIFIGMQPTWWKISQFQDPILPSWVTTYTNFTTQPIAQHVFRIKKYFPNLKNALDYICTTAQA
jgi:hypothetical protein